jgi:peptidoglycan/LPS O-acetylase OafA/YrhL
MRRVDDGIKMPRWLPLLWFAFGAFAVTAITLTLPGEISDNWRCLEWSWFWQELVEVECSR